MELYYYDHYALMNQLNFFAYSVGVHSTSPHTHNQSEFVYVWRGTLFVTIGDTQTEVGEGGMFFVNSLCSHAYQAKKGYAFCTFIGFNTKLLLEQFPELESSHISILVPGYQVQSRETNLLRALMLSGLKLYIHNTLLPVEIQRMQSIGHWVLSILLNDFLKIEETERKASNASRDKQISDYILEHFSQKVTLESLAEHLHLSPFYISHYFREAFGMTFHQYLVKIRISNARQLLKSSNKTVKDVSIDCGFNDINAFSKTFRKETGYSPTAYRRLNVYDNVQFDEQPLDLQYQTLKYERVVGYYQTKSGNYYAPDYPEHMQIVKREIERIKSIDPKLLYIYESYWS